ncbi:MAG: hypothetical protein WD810_08420 [Solirubrobacterales bacterium]
MSFVIDPPLLVASGAAIEAVTEDQRTARRRQAGVAAVFVAVSLALYANAPGLGLIWRPFGARSGREFMLASGLAPVEEAAITPRRHLAALSLFMLYPLWSRLGGALVRAARAR